jgi:transposase
MHAWLTERLGQLSGRSSLAQAIRYALNHWKGLIRFLDDGRFELDTNIVERAMRPVALGRKNALFAGADSGGKHWAIVATLIQTAKLNDVEPLAWLTDALKRIVSGQTKRNSRPLTPGRHHKGRGVGATLTYRGHGRNHLRLGHWWP